MSNELNSQDNDYITPPNPSRIWKISHSSPLTDEEKQSFRNKKIVVIGTGSQYGKAFLDIKAGDCFYLCYGSSIQLFGYFPYDTIRNNVKGSDWFERPYFEILPTTKPDSYFEYSGNDLGWMPGFSSCCKIVPNDKLSLFEECILEPYFGIKKLSEIPSICITRTNEIIEHLDNDNKPNCKNPLSKALINSKNIILRGAPGTGKTYLSRQIAADIVSDGEFDDYDALSPEYQQQIEFVQFHPSYDYTDFVEGLRPVGNNKQRPVDNDNDNASSENTHDHNKEDNNISIRFDLKSGIFKLFIESAKEDPEKKYVFIIDEINRGEISKIFGELFFSIDPEYRGKKEWAVKTQYANLHPKSEEDFYIPENVYIIGTMNDIDRSVDSFDFAMRRRFRFIEISAEASQIMLESLGDKKDGAIRCMNNLNKAISDTEGLNANYRIGAAYFLKLKDDGINFDTLWKDYLQPLLQEYVRGMSDEEDKMKAFKDAYNAAAPQPNKASESAKEEAEPAGESKEKASSAQATIQEEAVQHDGVN